MSTNDDLESQKMLNEINQNLNEFKDLIREEIHKLNLSFVEVRADIKNIDDKMSNKIDAMSGQLARIETEQATHDHHIMLMKDEIHRHDLEITNVKTLPEEVSKLRHKSNNNEQRVAILEEINNMENHEDFGKRLVKAEQEISLLKEKTKSVDMNTQMVNGQKAVFKFIQSKPIWTLIALGAAAIAASLGMVK